MSTKGRPVYQPWYEGDFWTLRVRHLHPMARLMYRSILQQGWDLPKPGKIPNDRATLMRLADCPDDETWSRHEAAILAMFDLSKDGTFYTNKRQQDELRNVRTKYQSYADRGRAGGKQKKQHKLHEATQEAQLKPSLSPAKKDGSIQNYNQNYNQNQSQSQDEDAEALPDLQLARKVIERLSLACDSRMLNAVEGAIGFCRKIEGKGANAAVEFLIAHGLDEIERGGAPTKFWFDDRKWRLANGTGKRSKLQENLDALAEL